MRILDKQFTQDIEVRLYIKQLARESENIGQARGIIYMGQKFGLSDADIAHYLMEELSVPQDKAEEYLRLYESGELAPAARNAV